MAIKELLEADGANDLMCEVLGKILGVPGVYEAVLIAAAKKYGGDEMKLLHNDGVARLGDLPNYYLWQLIQED